MSAEHALFCLSPWAFTAIASRFSVQVRLLPRRLSGRMEPGMRVVVLLRSALWIGVLLMTACLARADAGALRSPWDTAVAAQPAAVSHTCPAPPILSTNLTLTDYYSDPAHSIIDAVRFAAYQRALAPLRMATRKVVIMADRYRTTGNTAAARCVGQWLAAFATRGVLAGRMDTHQSVYVQGWMLGALAVAWLKIRPVGRAIEPAARQAVLGWLARVAEQNQAYYADRARTRDGRNNHRYWAGFAVMAAGIATDRRDLFRWGIRCFRIGVDQVTADGTLPLEMERRSRALHYHLFAAAPLVMMAELAAANDINLYAETGNALARLIEDCVSGMTSPQRFAVAAGAAQEPVQLSADNLAWAEPFARRFPNARLVALLAKLRGHSMLFIGGLPPPVITRNQPSAKSPTGY